MRHAELVVAALVAVVGCGPAVGLTDEHDPELLEARRQALACSPVSGTVVARALVEQDPVVLARFGFDRTLKQVLSSANASATTADATGLFQAWMRTWDTGAAVGCDRPSVDPSNYGLRCPRTAEASLANEDPFAPAPRITFQPVAIFNRFDLAPSNGANCGEYRIVYAMQGSRGRAFIIFEAALPNPRPDLKADGCLPIAQFWQGLSKVSAASTRASQLEKFFYLGTAISGVVPVVSALNYGMPPTAGGANGSGQVRTNFFVDPVQLGSRQWHLREFKVQRSCPTSGLCSVSMRHISAKNNPANEVFADGHKNSANFRSAFLNSVKALSGASAADLSMSTSFTFNEFESVSQGSQDVVYDNFASPGMRSAIATKLQSLGSTLTVSELLARATTQTCAGCHQLSNFANLGGGLVWPPAGGFVHVDEFGNLSQALTTAFLPKRLTVLEGFINARCSGAATTSLPGLTVAGTAEGASN